MFSKLEEEKKNRSFLGKCLPIFNACVLSLFFKVSFKLQSYCSDGWKSIVIFGVHTLMPRPSLSSKLVPSPSVFSKFSSSILKFFKHAQFFVYTQNHFLYSKVRFYYINCLIWVHLKCFEYTLKTWVYLKI